VKAVLASLPVREKVAVVRLVAEGPYSFVTPVGRLLPQFEAQIADRAFAANVTWEVLAPEEHAAALTAALLDLGRGEIAVRPLAIAPG
jgi:putative IMPACT (imprinted ancient) family translation regulator